MRGGLAEATIIQLEIIYFFTYLLIDLLHLWKTIVDKKNHKGRGLWISFIYLR